MGNARKGEEPLDEGRAGCPILAVEKERATTIRLTANVQVSGSACEVSARMVIVGSNGRASDIFHDPGCAALREGPQGLE
jgi:hypothetical protein